MHYHLTAIARLKVEDGRLDEALDLYEEAVTLCRRTRHLEGLTTTLRVRGDVLLNLERYEEALPDLEEAADLYSRMHDLPSEAQMRRGTAVARAALGNPCTAFDAWERALELARGIEDPDLEIEALEGIGGLLRRTDPAGSLRSYESALSLIEGSADRQRIGSLRYTIGILRWEFGAYEDALRSFEDAYEDLSDAGDSLHAGLVLNSIGRTLRDLGRFDEAKARLEEAIALNERNGERLLVAHALSTLGDVALDSEDPEEAIERFTGALALRKKLGDETGQAWVLCSLVRAQLARGAAGAAGAGYYLAEARDIAASTGDAELIRRCEALRIEVARVESEA
jgi:tetratricopeptide (TPR) repeat protein